MIKDVTQTAQSKTLQRSLKVSIVVPHYNCIPSYLRKCLQTCCEQTMNKSEYEVILVDDRSTNTESLEVIEEFRVRYPELLRFFQLEKNSGNASAPRNRGIDEAKGEYILFVDSDDYLGIETLERLSEFARLNDSDLVSFRRIPTERPGPRAFLKFGTIGDADIFEHRLYPHGNVQKFFRTDAINRINLRFDPSLTWGEDVLFIQTFYANKNKYSIYTDYECYAPTRHDEGNHLSSTKKTLESTYSCLSKVFSAHSKGNMSVEFQRELTGKVCDIILFAYGFKLNSFLDDIDTKKGAGNAERFEYISKCINEFVPVQSDAFMTGTCRAAVKEVRRKSMEGLILTAKVSLYEGRIASLEKENLILKNSLPLSAQLSDSTNIFQYVNLIAAQDNHLVIFAVRDTPCAKISIMGVYKKIGELGLTHSLHDKPRSSYIAVINKGVLLYEECGKEMLRFSCILGTISVDIVSANFNVGDSSSVMINDTEYSVNHRGLNIVVFDYKRKKVIDSVCFDAYDDFKVYRNRENIDVGYE